MNSSQNSELTEPSGGTQTERVVIVEHRASWRVNSDRVVHQAAVPVPSPAVCGSRFGAPAIRARGRRRQSRTCSPRDTRALIRHPHPPAGASEVCEPLHRPPVGTNQACADARQNWSQALLDKTGEKRADLQTSLG